MRAARRKVGSVLLPFLGPTTLRLLSSSWKVEKLAEEYSPMDSPEGALVNAWHGRMVALTPLFPQRDFHILVSPSDDGELVLDVLKSFGYRTIRGSTSRGAARALREMLGVLRKGGKVGITPDGPRGPLHSVNVGSAWLAKATGYPVVPIGAATDRAWHLKSWDNFTIPKPGARVAVKFGEPISVSRDADDQQLEVEAQRIRTSLLEAELAAFEHLGVEPDF